MLTLDRAGTNFQTPTMEGFVSKWASLFSRSPKASLAWKTQTGLPVPSYSETRWWSKWEVAKQVLIYFGDVVTFVNSSPADLAPATIGKLREVLHDPNQGRSKRSGWSGFGLTSFCCCSLKLLLIDNKN